MSAIELPSKPPHKESKIVNNSISLQMIEAGSSLKGYKFADTNGLRAQTINITVTQGKSVKRVGMMGPVMS